jgi:hypothetical protein
MKNYQTTIQIDLSIDIMYFFQIYFLLAIFP